MMTKPLFTLLALLTLPLVLSACSSQNLTSNFLTDDPQIADRTMSGDLLRRLPAPKQPVVLAVYNFEDKTGQHKPSDSFPEYSRAVTQGGGAILSKALYDAANGRWFTVLEREGLNNLVQERKIIRATRKQYTTPDGRQLNDIGPLLYAGLLIEGGIVSYESNIVTGGFGARYLGIGGDTQYRRDIVTVALRAINVQNGQVVMAVNTSKTIFSTALQGSIYKFVSIDRLLEIETGFTLNEPPQFAVRQAIEMGVYSMVMEGAMKGMWQFADAAAGRRAIKDYRQRRGGKDGDTGVANEAQDPPGLKKLIEKLEQKPVRAVPTPSPVVNVPVRQSAPRVVAPPVARPALPRQSLPTLPTRRPVANPTPTPSLPSTQHLQTPLPSAPARALPIRQLPLDSTLRSGAKPLNGQGITGGSLTGEQKKSLADQLDEPRNESILRRQRYRQRGTVYCGAGGCVPADEAAPAVVE